MPLQARCNDPRIRVTICERDLKDALLILYCYSCAEYVIDYGEGECEAAGADIAIEDRAMTKKVEVTARCEASAIPALLDELAAGLGAANSIRAFVVLD